MLKSEASAVVLWFRRYSPVNRLCKLVIILRVRYLFPLYHAKISPTRQIFSAVKYVTGHLPRIFAAFSYIFAGYAAMRMYIQGSEYAVLSLISETGKEVGCHEEEGINDINVDADGVCHDADGHVDDLCGRRRY